MDDSCRVCTGPGIGLGDAKSAPCRRGLYLGFTRIWDYGAVYTQNLIQQGTALDPGADPRGALRESIAPPLDGCWPKNRDASLGDKTCFWTAWRRQADQKLVLSPSFLQCALLFTHHLSGFTKTHQSVHATQWPKPVSIQFNCRNSIQNAPKLAFLSSKISTFSGEGHSPPQRPLRRPPSHTFWIRPWPDHEWSLMSLC